MKIAEVRSCVRPLQAILNKLGRFRSSAPYSSATAAAVAADAAAAAAAAATAAVVTAAVAPTIDTKARNVYVSLEGLYGVIANILTVDDTTNEKDITLAQEVELICAVMKVALQVKPIGVKIYHEIHHLVRIVVGFLLSGHTYARIIGNDVVLALSNRVDAVLITAYQQELLGEVFHILKGFWLMVSCPDDPDEDLTGKGILFDRIHNVMDSSLTNDGKYNLLNLNQEEFPALIINATNRMTLESKKSALSLRKHGEMPFKAKPYGRYLADHIASHINVKFRSMCVPVTVVSSNEVRSSSALLLGPRITRQYGVGENSSTTTPSKTPGL